MRIALCAGWRSALGRRGGEIFDPLFAVLSRLPFDGLVLDAGVSAAALADVLPVLRRREIPLPALRGPVGALDPAGGAEPSGAPRLSATDAALRRGAIEAHERALETASDLEVPVVTVALGAADPDPRYGRRDRPFTEEEALDLLRAARAAAPIRARALDAARLALDALCARAEALGVTVAVENPALPLELPSPEELHRLRGDFAGAPLGYAHDAGAARLCRELGGPPGRELLDAGREVLTAVFLCDAGGRETGLVPGRGEIDFAGLAQVLPADTPRVLAPRPTWSEADLEEAVTRLGDAGM